MKNVNQIRHLLKRMLAFSNVRPRNGADAVFAGLTREALALLPCERCNGSGRVSDLGGRAYTTDEPCPDCQPCKRCGGTNGVHKQVDDPQAGNSHMLTKMQCPNYQPKPKQEESSPSTMWEHLH